MREPCLLTQRVVSCRQSSRGGGTWPKKVVIAGECGLSWHCFLRSCLASLVAMVVMTVIWVAFHSTLFADWPPLHTSPGMQKLLEFVTFIGPVTIISLIPDYFSLLKSKFVISLMSKFFQ